jgi:hypothetical protein
LAATISSISKPNMEALQMQLQPSIFL